MLHISVPLGLVERYAKLITQRSQAGTSRAPAGLQPLMIYTLMSTLTQLCPTHGNHSQMH
jgi:hypothetical protein